MLEAGAEAALVEEASAARRLVPFEVSQRSLERDALYNAFPCRTDELRSDRRNCSSRAAAEGDGDVVVVERMEWGD